MNIERLGHTQPYIFCASIPVLAVLFGMYAASENRLMKAYHEDLVTTVRCTQTPIEPARPCWPTRYLRTSNEVGF